MENDIIKIISNVSEVPAKKIKLESNLISDLGLESLDLVTLVSEFEDKYKVTVEDKDIKDLQTVKDIIDYIEKHV